MARDDWKAAVEKEYAPPKNIQRLINAANDDLYNGPNGDVSFSTAIKKISAWADKRVAAGGLPRELWYDTQSGELLEKEPRGEEFDGEWQEPMWDDYIHLEYDDIKKAIFGSELAGYV